MNKQQLEESNNTCIALIITLTIFIIIYGWFHFFDVDKDTKSYQQGFQDGQANSCSFENVKTNMSINTELTINFYNATNNTLVSMEKLNCNDLFKK